MEINNSNYREFKAINYSLLSTLSLNPALVKQDRKETDSMYFGSMFDCLLTDADRFNAEYIVATVKKPTAQLGDFIDLFLNFKASELSDENAYQASYDEMKARNPKLRDGLEKFKERMESEAKDWLEYVELSTGKKIVSSEDYYLATVMRDSLMASEFTGKYFNMDYNWEIMYQTPLLATLENGFEFKGLLDMMLINYTTKEIYPIDIKTTSDYPNQFQNSVIKYNYLIQSSLYWDIVQANYPDFKIHDFMFFVSSKELPNKPYIWGTDEKSRTAGRHGYMYNGKFHKGYYQLADDLKWHEDNGLWEYPRTTYENGGINKIDFFL